MSKVKDLAITIEALTIAQFHTREIIKNCIERNDFENAETWQKKADSYNELLQRILDNNDAEIIA